MLFQTRTQIKIFLMKSKSFLTLHKQQGSYHVQGPERYQKHRQNCPCNISGSTVMSYLWMNGWQRSAFSFSTHTHTEARVMSQGGHKHKHNISRTALSHFMSVSQFHLTKTILISYTHRNVKVFTATRQNKSLDFVKTLQYKYLFSRIYILLLKLWKRFFLRNDYTTFLKFFNFNSKFPLFAKESLIFNSLKINWIYVLCLHLITRYTTQNFWGKRKHFMRLF